MADTIVTNTPGTTNSDSAAGWVVALIVLAAIVIGGLIWYRSGAPVPAGGGTNINVSVPTPSAGTGGTGGAAQ